MCVIVIICVVVVVVYFVPLSGLDQHSPVRVMVSVQRHVLPLIKTQLKQRDCV